jgi:hypothetical protein
MGAESGRGCRRESLTALTPLGRHSEIEMLYDGRARRARLHRSRRDRRFNLPGQRHLPGSASPSQHLKPRRQPGLPSFRARRFDRPFSRIVRYERHVHGLARRHQ